MPTSLLLFYSCVSFTNHCYKAQHFSPAPSFLNGVLALSKFNYCRTPPHHGSGPRDPLTSPGSQTGHQESHNPQFHGHQPHSNPYPLTTLTPLPAQSSAPFHEHNSLAVKFTPQRGVTEDTKAPVNRNLLLASPSITTLFAPKNNTQATTK